MFPESCNYSQLSFSLKIQKFKIIMHFTLNPVVLWVCSCTLENEIPVGTVVPDRVGPQARRWWSWCRICAPLLLFFQRYKTTTDVFLCVFISWKWHPVWDQFFWASVRIVGPTKNNYLNKKTKEKCHWKAETDRHKKIKNSMNDKKNWGRSWSSIVMTAREENFFFFSISTSNFKPVEFR